ncbi:MAG: shikimate dehydrogenase [Selenomonadaceae bacterium]|nr:shikimate dehydrogenase [Selenomonadaceae bacterium]
MASTEIKNFGIIGWPVGHSLSPKMYQAAFKSSGFPNYNYIAMPIQAGRLMLAVDGLKGLDFRGINVTIPHKTHIIKYLDSLDADARIIGAVNTVVNDGGMLTGYNTDVTGFLAALAEADFMPEDSNAVILGSGGAARAVLWGLCKRKAGYVTIGARNAEKAKNLAADFKRYGSIEGYDWLSEEFKENLKTADILINATPLGMYPDVISMPPVDLKLLPEGALVYDIVYNPAKTKLLAEAEKLGFPTLSGMSMLLLQGKESYRLFTGENPDVDIMWRILKQELKLK